MGAAAVASSRGKAEESEILVVHAERFRQALAELPGVSERIRVVSLVGRFLEHSRLWCFANGGDEEFYIGSADWMPRNLDRRVEIAFPVLEPVLQDQIRDILETQLADTVKARRILADGRSVRIGATAGPALRSQERLYEATGAERP